MTIEEIQTLRKGGRFTEALAMLDRHSDQGSPLIVEERFNIAFAMRDVETTVKVATQLKQLDRKSSIRAVARCGLLLRESGDANRAVEFLTDAVNIAGNDLSQLPEWSFATLYGAHSDLKDYKAAVDAALAGAQTNPILYVWASHAQRALGDFSGAGVSLDEAIIAFIGQQEGAETVLDACRALLAQRPEPGFQRIVTAAEIAFGIKVDVNLQTAEQAAKIDDWNMVALVCCRVIQKGDKTLLSALKELTRAVKKNPKLHKPFMKALELAVAIQPMSQEVVFVMQDYLSAGLTHIETINYLIDIQQRGERLFPALVVEIARAGQLETLRDKCKPQVDLMTRSRIFRSFEKFVAALCAFEDVSEDLLSSIYSIHPSELRQFLLFRRPELKIVRARNLTANDRRLLAAAGVDVPKVNDYLDRLTTIPREYSQYIDDADVASPRVRDRIRKDEAYVAFQDYIVSQRRFDMVDPLTGNPAELFDSVMIFDRQVFAFRGAELLTFISGGNMNAGVFLYSVGLNLLLKIDTESIPCSQAYYGSDIHMAELFAVYISRAARAYRNYLAAATEAATLEGNQREVIAIHGRAENPAHHIWNYLSPFERLNMLGILGNISAVVPPPTDYFGDIRSIFPEIATTKFLSLPVTAVVDPCPFSLSEVAICLGGNFIPKQLKRRIHRWAKEAVPIDKLDGIEALVQKHGPIVWVGLRSGDKVWTNQTEGLIQVINAICEEYSDALFLLDGFSVPKSRALIPEKWSLQVEELRLVADQICRRVNSPDCVLSLIGNTIAESVVWAGNVSLYFTPLGSSQHKVGWYCAAPGIVYTTSKVQTISPDLRPGAWEAEGSAVPDFIVGEIAAPGKRRGNFDFRTNLENVEFAVATVVEVMKRILATTSYAKPEGVQ